MDKTGKTWSDWGSVAAEIEKFGPNAAPGRLVEGMFAPVDKAEERIPLERCMRVYAHQQDTGGFFIAVLEKVTEFKAKPESESKKIEAKPAIISIVEEILSRPAPKDGENVAPKIEAADLLTPPDDLADDSEVTPVARQNQEYPHSDATTGTKREFEADDAEVDAEISNKKLKIKEDADEPASDGMQDREVHFPPPPGAELDLTTRPGDLRGPPKDRQKNRGGQQFEEPFKYIAGDHAEVKGIEEFYKLSPRFPRDRFMVRNAMGDPVKTIYYTSALIRDILVENEGKGIKFIHGGVRMFMKQDVQAEGVCRWRIQSEGMPILEGYVGEERVVRLYKKETLKKLLIEMFPKVNDGGWENLGEIGERVRDIGMGCCVLRVEPSDQEDGFDERLVLPLWRSLHSLNLMLAKEDRTAMLLRILDDSTPLVNNHHPGMKREDRVADPADPTVATGFVMEDGEVKVNVETSALEASASIDTPDLEIEIKPGPYGDIVAAEEAV
jgi:multisite-specific tRNA:(cytosine-C5)-methyltransferase